MNLEPRKTAEIRTLSGTARALASLIVLALATLGILVVLEIIPRAAFAEAAGKTAIVGGICVVTAVAIGLLTRR